MAEATAEAAAEVAVACGEAARTAPFWLLHAANLCMLIPWNGLNFHMAAVMAEAGLEPDAAIPLVYAPLALAGASSALLMGPAIDRMRRGRELLSLAVPPALMALTLTAVLLVRHHWQAAGVGLLLGTFVGVNNCVGSVVPAVLFGRRHLGSIQASFFVSAQLASAFGSFAMGAAKDSLGSFRPIFYVLVALNGVLALVVCAYVMGRRAPDKKYVMSG